MKSRREFHATVLLFAALGGGCGAGSSDEPTAASAAQVPIGIVDFAGLERALAARRGEGFLLNFWAMWCAPCVAELPELLEVVRAHEGALLTVSYDLMIPGAERETIESELRAFLAERELAMPVLVYDESDFALIDERFGLPGDIPVTLAIDARGEIVDRENDAAGRERFEEMLSKALAK